MSKGKGQALGSIFAPAGSPAGPDAAVAQTARAVAPPASAFFGIVDRLEAVLDAETEALSRNISADMTELGNRKRQGLLELTRTLRAAAVAGPKADIQERLRRFALTLERNRAVLGTQLRAVREIADIIAETIKEAESDGTYSLLTGRS
jgi:hypothetical protein